MTSFAMLVGNPISGALLDEPHYRWDRPIIFNGVLVLAGCVFLIVSRQLVVKKQGALNGWIV